MLGRAVTGELQGALTDCNEAIRLEPNLAAGFDPRRYPAEIRAVGFGHSRL